MRLTSRIAPAALLLAATLPAFAGPYADDLAKCLVDSTSNGDRNDLVQWMFVSIALHPQVQWMGPVPEGKRTEVNQKTARLFEKLLVESCLAKTQAALKYEGAGTIESAFGVLGQVAARGLFEDPSVAQGVADLQRHMDGRRIEKALGAAK